MDVSTVIFSVIFGSIGLGFFVYGKKQQAIVPLVSGLGLMISPYVISNPYLMSFAGIVMVALPFLFKI